MIVKFFIACLLTEAITEILVKSEVFSPIRRRLFSLRGKSSGYAWFSDLIECGYCSSVWVGCAMSWLLISDFGLVNIYIDWFLLGLVVHRCSNVVHFCIDRLRG